MYKRQEYPVPGGIKAQLDGVLTGSCGGNLSAAGGAWAPLKSGFTIEAPRGTSSLIFSCDDILGLFSLPFGEFKRTTLSLALNLMGTGSGTHLA